MAYAYECAACRHLLTLHGLEKDAPSVNGPYRCRRCDCQIEQHSPRIELTKRDFEQRHGGSDD